MGVSNYFNKRSGLFWIKLDNSRSFPIQKYYTTIVKLFSITCQPLFKSCRRLVVFQSRQQPLRVLFCHE